MRRQQLVEFIKFLQVEMPALLQCWREHKGWLSWQGR